MNTVPLRLFATPNAARSAEHRAFRSRRNSVHRRWSRARYRERIGDDRNAVDMMHEAAGVSTGLVVRVLEGGELSVSLAEFSGKIMGRKEGKILALSSATASLEIPLKLTSEIVFAICRRAWIAHCAVSVEVRDSGTVVCF